MRYRMLGVAATRRRRPLVPRGVSGIGAAHILEGVAGAYDRPNVRPGTPGALLVWRDGVVRNPWKLAQVDQDPGPVGCVRHWTANDDYFVLWSTARGGPARRPHMTNFQWDTPHDDPRWWTVRGAQEVLRVLDLPQEGTVLLDGGGHADADRWSWRVQQHADALGVQMRGVRDQIVVAAPPPWEGEVRDLVARGISAGTPSERLRLIDAAARSA